VRPPLATHPESDERLRRVTLVLGVSAGGMGAHIRMLATGLCDQGIAVSVIGPSSADPRFSFSALPTVSFFAVEIAERPRAGDLASIVRLRRLLLRVAPDGGQVVHAHGLRAGALTVLALSRVKEPRRPAVVVTVHNAPPDGGVAGLAYRLLERVVARGADLVLCVSPDLERRMRATRARRVRSAVIAAPSASPGRAVPGASAGPPSGPPPVIAPAGRPVVLAAGRLAPQKGFSVLLRAAAAWRDLNPVPLLVIAGDGPLAGELRAQADTAGVDAVFLGHRDDVPALLAAAAVFVLPSTWEGQPLVLQEALRAGTPVVATRVGGIPGLAGEDAAVLVARGDAPALAAAVRSVLTDPPLAARLRAAAAARAAALPTEADAVAAARDAYNSARPGRGLR
jgi:glycosyltransferase involved in cell wall biosynthesis